MVISLKVAETLGILTTKKKKIWGDTCVNYFDLGNPFTMGIKWSHLYFKYIQLYLSIISA